MKNILKDNYRFYSVLGVIVLFMVLAYQTCNYWLQLSANKKALQKPFIIVGKCTGDKWGTADYTFTDINGNVSNFTDRYFKFIVGDTLK